MSGEGTGGNGASHESDWTPWLWCGQGETLAAASLVLVAAIAWSPTMTEWVGRLHGEVTGSPSAELIITTFLYLMGLVGMILLFGLSASRPAIEADVPPAFAEEAPPPVIEKIGVAVIQPEAGPSLRATTELSRSDLLLIDNISPMTVRKLNQAGILSLKDLVTRGGTLAGRQGIARQTGINIRRLTDWMHKVDLMEAAGLDIDEIRLLEVAGIGSVSELLTEDPHMVLKKITAYNGRSHVTDQLPSLDDLQKWIDQARQRGSILQ